MLLKVGSTGSVGDTAKGGVLYAAVDFSSGNRTADMAGILHFCAWRGGLLKAAHEINTC